MVGVGNRTLRVGRLQFMVGAGSRKRVGTILMM